MRKKEEIKAKLSTLKLMAEEYSEDLGQNIRRIEKDDLTDILEHDLKTAIQYKEHINIQVNGDVSTGKSTLAIKLAQKINNMLGKKMSMEYISADQIDFNRYMGNPKLENCCIVIDEFNPLAKTDTNATIEQELLRTFSNIHAQRYVHRIACAPMETIDDNARIFLNILGVDRDKKVTIAKVYYKHATPQTVQNILLGHIKVFVGDIIEEPFYKEYVKRKKMRWDFLTKVGVRDLRRLEDAGIVLAAYKQLEPYGIFGMAKTAIIANEIKKQTREKQRFVTILGEDDLVRQTKALLDADTALSLIKRKIAKLREKKEAPEELKKIEELAQRAIDTQKGHKEELERLIEIYEKYIKF